MVVPRLLLLTASLVSIAENTTNVSSTCFRDTLDFLSDLNSKEPQPYAVLMYDALGKQGSNLLSGNIDRIGSYSQCRSVTAPSRNFTGEYCKLHVEQEGTKFVIGICVPSSCSSQDITSLSKMDVFEYKGTSFLAPLPVVLTQNESSLTVMTATCVKGLFAIDAFAIVCLCLCGALITLPIIGSIYTGVQQLKVTPSFARFRSINSKRKDAISTERDKLALKSSLPLAGNDGPKKTRNCIDHLLKSFCLQENISTLLKSSTNREYPTLDGIRVLSLLWIVSGHTGQLASVFNMDNSFEWKSKVLEKPVYFYTLSGPVYLGVDSFFLLSGFLSAISFLKITENSEKTLTPLIMMKFICRRLRRLQPLHLASICFSIALITLVHWGSFWELPKHQWDNCRRVWWANVLLITNFVSVAESCSGWAWYLSNDFQFHLTTPVLIFLYVKAKRALFAVAVLLLLTSSLVTTLLSYYLQLSIRYPTGDSHSRLNYWVEYYTKPYCRYGPFLIGITLAIWISKKESPCIKYKVHAVIGWFCSLLTMLLIITLCFVLDDTPTSYSIMAAIYQGLHRTLWAAAVAWIIISCQEGYGGFINTLLSCNTWSFLSRISYACYLTHPVIIILYCGLQETLFHYLDINMFYMFIGHSMLTITAGFILTVLVEKPFQQLFYS
ncbi:O-acyltransferase like protein-like [Spea bombifrons]|uniref:O-acyltransferase like protein-like n=1 Tax=Spea bombifrons TaxID=233779 RepID=UPI00234B175F|nr:O-acyltransferase like protein-like [Spea bombifrons]